MNFMDVVSLYVITVILPLDFLLAKEYHHSNRKLT